MHRNHLLANLATYYSGSFITQEEHKKYDELKEFIAHNPHCFDRKNDGHITGSVWLVNHDMTQVLLTHHKKLNIWLQLGGHADGDPDIKAVALKEAQEESGIDNLEFVYEEIFDIDIHPVPKCTAHYDVRYLIRAPKDALYIVSEESHDLAWVSLEDVPTYSKEPSVLRMTEKLKRIRVR